VTVVPGHISEVEALGNEGSIAANNNNNYPMNGEWGVRCTGLLFSL
jgi:hypothetical protein